MTLPAINSRWRMRSGIYRDKTVVVVAVTQAWKVWYRPEDEPNAHPYWSTRDEFPTVADPIP